MKDLTVVEARMKLALESARRGAGRTYPNPSVGAVVWKGSQVLGRGVTRPPGGPHAEVVALQSATRRHGDRAVRGASMGVTLEPCCFQGRTAPCTRAIIEAGLRRVYVGCRKSDLNRRIFVRHRNFTTRQQNGHQKSIKSALVSGFDNPNRG